LRYFCLSEEKSSYLQTATPSKKTSRLNFPSERWFQNLKRLFEGLKTPPKGLFIEKQKKEQSRVSLLLSAVVIPVVTI
jgi:hypothetical protein